MDPQLKQRLVGAAVLMALAVLVIPAFLDQEDVVMEPVVRRDMAPMPVAEPPETLSPVDPAVMEEITSGMDAAGDALEARLPAEDLPAPPAMSAVPPAEGTTAAPVKPVPAVNAAVVVDVPHATPSVDAAADAPAPARPGDWVIQLGSFAREENAAALRDRIAQSGLAAYVSPLGSDGRRTYRVRVAGGTSREAADRLHARLQFELGFSGMVVRAE
ncbi:MAG: SPOR domain-containing protein [Gammaproteobacteria bacterium]